MIIFPFFDICMVSLPFHNLGLILFLVLTWITNARIKACIFNDNIITKLVVKFFNLSYKSIYNINIPFYWNYIDFYKIRYNLKMPNLKYYSSDKILKIKTQITINPSFLSKSQFPHFSILYPLIFLVSLTFINLELIILIFHILKRIFTKSNDIRNSLFLVSLFHQQSCQAFNVRNRSFCRHSVSVRRIFLVNKGMGITNIWLTNNDHFWALFHSIELNSINCLIRIEHKFVGCKNVNDR